MGARRQGGLTLIEVMVALAIIAVGLAGLVRAGAVFSAQAAQLRDRSEARWVANNIATRLTLQQYWGDIGERTTGREPMGLRDWHWRSEVLELEDEDLRRVDIFVAADAEAQNSFYSVSLLLVKPGFVATAGG